MILLNNHFLVKIAKLYKIEKEKKNFHLKTTKTNYLMTNEDLKSEVKVRLSKRLMT